MTTATMTDNRAPTIPPISSEFTDPLDTGIGSLKIIKLINFLIDDL